MVKTDDEAKTERRITAIFSARRAIVRAAGPWQLGVEASGSIPCPACKTGKVSYSRAGCNGHIWAQCSTPDCVRWIE